MAFWIQKAIKRPGRIREYAKRLGISVSEAIQRAARSKNKSLAAAGRLAKILRKLRRK